MDIASYLKSCGKTQREFAAQLGVTQSALSQWICGRVPAERVLQVERATGSQVTRHELRPDLYPLEPYTPASGNPEAETAGQEVG